MDAIDKTAPDTPRKKRRWKAILGILLATVAALVLAFPFLLSTGRARAWLLERANAGLSPGRIEVDRFSFSWFRPTRLQGVVIRDPGGKAVISSPLAECDRNLFQLLFRRPKYGTIRLQQSVIDVERRGDGSIDLVDALRAIFTGEREPSFRIVIEGFLRLRSPELAEAIESQRFGLVLDRPSAPGAISWVASLDDPDQSVVVSGDYRRWDGRPVGENDFHVTIEPKNRPLVISLGDRTVRATLDGQCNVDREAGRFRVEGDAKSIAIDLNGDRLPLSATWSLVHDSGGWDIRSLDVTAPFGRLEAARDPVHGATRAGNIRGRIDLPELVRCLPKTIQLKEGLSLHRGGATIRVDSESSKTSRTWAVKATLEDIEGRLAESAVSLRDPATLSIRVKQHENALSVESASLSSSFANLQGRGDLASGLMLDGSIDLAGLSRQLADFIDLGSWEWDGRGDLHAELKRDASKYVAGVKIALPTAAFGPKGDALALTDVALNGSLQADRSDLTHWGWEAIVAVGSARRAGLVLEQAQLKMRRGASGSLVIDPLDAKLNGGRLRVVAEYQAKPSPALLLKPGAELIDSEVNEEASRRVLAFIAPILDGATRAKGRVSARIDRAVFPLDATLGAKAQVEGRVVFQDLEFSPGPIAEDILGLVGRSESVLRLNQPVVLAIADGRIRQSGLSIPVGKLAKIELAGDVGFDRSLDLRATIPLSGDIFPNNPLLADVAAGTRIVVPITGTLSRPRIDKEAFRAELARTGKGAALRAGVGLLFRLGQTRDPNAPPPMTPQERRAKRQEKKLMRRGNG